MQIIYSAIYIKKSFFRGFINAWMEISMILLLFLSCNTADFDLQKLSTSNLKPKVYVPLAYGTYDIKNYLPSVISGSDNQVINIPKIQLLPLTWYKGDFLFQPEALDSAFMEITVINGSPMKAEFSFTFTDYNTGTAYGRSYSGEAVPALSDSEPKASKFIFPLTYNDLLTIKSTDGVTCNVNLLLPDNKVGITLGSIKKSQFQIQINFTSGLLIRKLN